MLISGAPYVPSKKRELTKFLKSLDIKPGEKLIDLGSGDGQVIKIAAASFRLKAVGYELNPYLVLISNLRLWRLGKLAQAKVANLWRVRIPEDTTYVYFFIMPKHMPRLMQMLREQITWDCVLISYAFELPGLTPFAKSHGYYAYRSAELAKHPVSK